jgi:hypothetical protein
MKLLDLEFANAAGKAQHLKVKYVKQDLDEETVRQAMNKLSTAKLFQKDGEDMYVTPKAAQYVETIHEPIFAENN